MRLEEIVAVLRLNPDQTKKARRMLGSMLDQGQIVRIKKDRLCIPKDADLISGRIMFRQSGSAILIPDSEAGKKGVQGFPISAEDTATAFHGDQVLARKLERPKKYFRGRRERGRRRPEPEPDEKPNVRVIRILKRARANIVGNLSKGRHTWYVIPDDPRIIQDFIVPDPANTGIKPLPKEGDKVVVKVLEWKQRHLNPEGEIIDVLGKTHEPDAEFQAILYKYELDPQFPPAVIEQTDDIPDKVQPADRKGRKDCRDIFTFTIDPDDAKDFDDAVSVEELDDGAVRVGIHIADVSGYVKPDTPLDVEAQKRGNSTYLVGTVIPMLPHALSNGLCSLVEAEDRLTKSVFITYGDNAGVQKVDYARTVIRSNKRLTYAQAYAFMQTDDLDEVRKTPLPPKHQTGSTGRSLDEVSEKEMQTLQRHIRKLWSIASLLRKKRFRNGSLDLEMTEIKIYVDEEGYADRIEKQSHDESHQLIEEFMLAANEAVARFMKKNRFPCIYRVHDEPEEEKLQELRETMSTYGIKCGNLTNPQAMSALLKQLKDHPQGYTLKTHVLRSLKQAQYRASPDGHYGLAKQDYTHFTSPIRRYSDLIVHRVFDAYLHKHRIESAPDEPDAKYALSKLESIGDHLCVTERNSIDAERESVKTKLLEFYERQLKKDLKQPFEAVITDIKNHGLYIEITDSMAFGMVHISTLDDDFYNASPDGKKLTGRKTGNNYSVADTIQVVVERVDRFKRQIDFRIVRDDDYAKGSKGKGPRGKKKANLAQSPKELAALRKQRRADRLKNVRKRK